MPNQYKPGLLQCRPQYTSDPDSGDTPENVLWFLSSSLTTPTPGNLTSIAAVFDPAWGNMWAEVGCTTTHYNGSVWTDWSSSSGYQYTSVGTFTPKAGSATGLVPPQVACLISYPIQLRWRGGHFRTYLPYLGNSILTGFSNDTIESTQVTAVESAFSTMIGDMAGSGILGGQGFRVYKDKNAVGATLYPIITQTCNPIVATQRRRVRHVGRR